VANRAVNQARAHHGHPVVRAESQVVVHRLLGVLAGRVASLEVTLLQVAPVAHGIHLVVINTIRNLLMAVEEGIRRPSLPTPNHRTLNHRIPSHHHLLPRIRIPNHHTRNHPTPNQATLNQVTHLISPRMTDTMVAMEANGARVHLHRALRGARAVGSRARVEEDREVPRVVGDHQARGRVASLVERI